MRTIQQFSLLVVCLAASAICCAQSAAKPAAPLPQVRKNGAATQFFVDGKPYIMLAGELHNSSASSIEYMKPIWEKLAKMNLNTVIGTVSWELLEPVEGKFDYTLVDAQIQEARKRHMRLVLIWFATWKNGDSTYVPYWVKTDRKRFPPMRLKGGSWRESLSPLGEASLSADAKAFRALMRHIREFDPQHTVIMMQVENEPGLLGDSRDWSEIAEAAWAKAVPAELMNHLAKNKANLLPEMQEVWGRNGYKASGTWAEVFGSDEWADEVFMAWHVARYIGKVAEAGKAELNIPMYANAWLGPQPNMPRPGTWPSGGPVARVHDIWRAAAPSIDLLAPDIYVQDFKGTCALYARSGNPLFIPEARGTAGNLFWAFGQHAAVGWSPFGIESLPADHQVAEAYNVLGGILPQLAEWQSAGKVAGVLVEGEEPQVLSLAGYKVTVGRSRSRFPAAPEPAKPAAAGPMGQGPDTRPFGMIVSTGPDEFLLVGSGFTPSFAADSAGPMSVGIASIDEGRYEQGKWVAGRRLNGDEFRPSLRGGTIGMLKVKLYRY